MDIPLSTRDNLSYDPETGELHWLATSRRRVFAGKKAGSLDKRGYLCINFANRRLRGHRVAWFLMTGEQPPALIDHKDGNPPNNHWSNLRAATAMLNNANMRPKTGLPKGVTLHRQTGRYQAQVKSSGKSYYLGLFDSPQLAHVAYVERAAELFGEFARAA